jgi:hypothetical protein
MSAERDDAVVRVDVDSLQIVAEEILLHLRGRGDVVHRLWSDAVPVIATGKRSACDQCQNKLLHTSLRWQEVFHGCG